MLKTSEKISVQIFIFFSFLTSSVGPVTTTSRREKEGRVGLLEEVSGCSELLLLFDAHTVGLGLVGSGSVEREVIALKVTLKGQKSLDNSFLCGSAFFEGAN